jgi:type III secretion protein R
MNGLALILTLYIMNPVIQETFEILQGQEVDTKQIESIREAVVVGQEPIKAFLLKHSNQRERAFFFNSAKKLSPMTISLPFKLLLFVVVDGWTRLVHGLVLTYA